MSEFRRIFFSRRMLLTWLLGCFLCCVFFAYECHSTKNITLSGEELQSYIDSYPDFLQSVKDNAKGVSMLAQLSDNTDFTRNNIDKTLSDYSRLEGLALSVSDNKGIVLYSNFVLGDGIIIAIVLVVLIQFAEEKKKGLVLLVRSTKNGRSHLILERVGILAMTAFFASLLVTASCMFLANMLCGAVGFERPLQSVSEFSLCAMPITIGQYLILSVLLKALAAFTFGVFVQLLLTWLEAIPAILAGGSVLLLQFLLYTLILGTDKLSGFKLANIIALLRTEIFFKYYYNINLFGNAVGFLLFSAVVISVAAIGFAILSIGCAAKCTETDIRIGIMNRIKVWFSKNKPNPPLFVWELRKVFVHQGGLLILAIICYFAASFCLEYPYSYNLNSDREYYYEKYAGIITQKKIDEMQTAYDDKLQIYLDKCDEIDYLMEYEPESEKLIPLMQDCYDISESLQTFEVIIKDAAQALDYTLKTGRPTQLVNPDAYEMLFIRDKMTTDKNSMFILLGLIGIFSGIIVCEKECNMTLWLNTVSNGRKKLLFTKLGVMAMTVPILTFGVCWAQLYQVEETIGFRNFDASVQSISFFREVPFSISIGGYLMLIYGLRILFAFLISLLIMGISALTSNRVVCMFISFVVLVVPMVLSLSGIVDIFNVADLLGFWEMW